MEKILSAVNVNLDTSSARMFQWGPNYSFTVSKAESLPTNVYLAIYFTGYCNMYVFIRFELVYISS